MSWDTEDNGANDGIEQGKEEDGYWNIEQIPVIADRNGHVTIQAVDTIAYDGTPNESDCDVTRIVDTQVKAGVAVDKRPQDHGYYKEAVAHQQREEHRNGESVAGVGGEESIVASPISVNNIDQMSYLWIVGRTPTGYKRLYQHVVYCAGKENT